MVWNVFFHKVHAYHSQKYGIALETQKKALNNFVKEQRPLDAENTTDLIQKLQMSPAPLSKSIFRALDVLVNNPENLDVREQNAKCLYYLRKALTYKKYQDKDHDYRPILHCLCNAKFLQNIMTDYEDEFVKEVIEKVEEDLRSKNGYKGLYDRLDDAIKTDNLDTIANLIGEANQLLEMAPYDLKKSPQALNWQKFTNTAGVFSDALGTSNISEVRSFHKVSFKGKEREIAYMRHGTITMEPGVNAALNRAIGQNTVQIVPEYRGFLDSLAVQGKKLLYTNHQDMSKAGPECSRGEKIQTLESDFAGTFFFLSLPNDGPIVKKIGEKTTEEWKSLLIDSLIKEKYGFRVPAELKARPDYEKRFNARFKELADEIQKLYFPDVQELSEIERRVFLPIFYFYVKETIKAECEIDIIVSVCKDNKDRGNASSGVDEILIELHSEEKNPNSYYDLFVRILAPFIIKYEHIIHHRLRVFLNVLKHIHTLTDVQRKAISGNKVLTPLQYKSQKFPR